MKKGIKLRFILTGLLCLLISACGTEGSRAGLNTQSNSYASLLISDGPTFDFGVQLVGQTLEHVFTVTNQGKQKATQVTSAFYLSQTFLYKGGVYPGTGGTCGSEIPVSDSCSLVVVFAPKSNQLAQASLNINYFDGLSQSQTSGNTLRGTGLYSISQ